MTQEITLLDEVDAAVSALFSNNQFLLNVGGVTFDVPFDSGYFDFSERPAEFDA